MVIGVPLPKAYTQCTAQPSPAKYSEWLSEILKLILFSMISVLTGEALSRVPAHE